MAIPIDLAYKGEVIPAVFNSFNVKPLPNLIFLLYLFVCPLTAGLK